MVAQYERFSKIFVILMPFVWAISRAITLPIMPGSNVQVITLKPADTMTHFSGITAFFIGSNLLKFQTTFFILTFLINLAVIAINANRAGMLAFLNAFAIVSISKYKSGKIWKILTILIFIILLILFINPEIFEPIFSKIASIFVDNQERQGTKNYRLDWWTYIINYTIFGDYFWTGKGFGINLGVDAGFDPLGDGNVRSPHNGHISVLARTGVPGLVLWLLVQLSWAGTILLKFRQSSAKGQTKWAGVFLTLLAFWIASMTVTTFEVIIEGPTGGIWLWTMYGVGLAAIKLHKTHPEIMT
ncbi:O-antigen ligase family protein [Nostoc sp. CCY0012]|uniref:O-antigen ligase family protein n=1 Tax=Nostoc sp. CCY0012 TaxID=1056123 RepID=UPI0039C67729